MQEKIIKLLEKVGKPLSRTEIAEKLNSTPIKVSMALVNMIKYDEVCCVEINKDLALKIYKCKRRLRLYYVSK